MTLVAGHIFSFSVYNATLHLSSRINLQHGCSRVAFSDLEKRVAVKTDPSVGRLAELKRVRVLDVSTELKGLGPDFVFGFVQSMDGERDPRNLLLAFQIAKSVVLRGYDLGENASGILLATVSSLCCSHCTVRARLLLCVCRLR